MHLIVRVDVILLEVPEPFRLLHHYLALLEEVHDRPCLGNLGEVGSRHVVPFAASFLHLFENTGVLEQVVQADDPEAFGAVDHDVLRVPVEHQFVTALEVLLGLQYLVVLLLLDLAKDLLYVPTRPLAVDLELVNLLPIDGKILAIWRE